jgi:hypothetical protein
MQAIAPLFARRFAGTRTPLWVVAWLFAAALLTGIVLMVSSPEVPKHSKTGDASRLNPSPGTEPDSGSAGDQVTVKGSAVPASFSIRPSSVRSLGLVLLIGSLAALAVGLSMVIGKQRSPAVRAFGGVVTAASMLLSAKFSGTLLRELKLDALLKIDKLSVPLTFRFDSRVLNAGPTPTMGAEPVGSIGPFPRGAETLCSKSTDTDCAQSTDTLLRNFVDRHFRGGPNGRAAALILLVGSADRQRLSGRLRSRFDSNMGLARARAEWLKEQLTTKFPGVFGAIPFLVLSSGPEKTRDPVSARDLEQDRKVEVWAHWKSSRAP